jgi:hypothetical protein
MWTEPDGQGRAAPTAWWPDDVMLAQPWRTGLVFLAGLLGRFRPPGRGVHVPPLSPRWLHEHEVEAGKHDDR